MRYAKVLEADSCARDAALVNDLYKKSAIAASPRNIKAFEAAQEWFVTKHKTSWEDYVKTEERQR